MNKIVEFLPNDSFQVCAWSWQKAHWRSEGHAALPDELRIMLVGTEMSAYATFSCHARPLQHFLTFYGTKNTAHLDFSSGTLTLSPTTVLPGALGRVSRSFDEGWQHFREAGRNVLRFARSKYHPLSGFGELVSTFYDSINHDSQVPIPYHQIRRVSAVVDAVIEQLSESKAEKVAL